MMSESGRGPLAGVRVLDLTRLLPGPFCTLYLAQLGAEVIKIEEPDGGDYARALSPDLFALINRGKKSVLLDLRQDRHVEQFHELVATADVVIESFRPGVMERFGCGYLQLKAVNPRIVYASLTGYGQTGPYRDRAGHDLNYCAYAGVLDQIGRAGGAPAIPNVQIADLAGGGLTCSIGILAALYQARASGRGAQVDVSMTDGALALQPVTLAALNSRGEMPARGADMLSGALPNYQVYRCRGGGYLAVGALEWKFFQRFLGGIQKSIPVSVQNSLQKVLPGSGGAGRARAQGVGKGRRADTELMRRLQKALQDPGLARKVSAPLRAALAIVMRTRSREEWMRILEDMDACVAPVLTLEESLGNEQILARDMVETVDGKPALAFPVRFDQPLQPLGVSPELGQHTEEVLAKVLPTGS